MADLTVANTIAAQMGGTGRLGVMIGASGFLGSDDGLMFAFRGCRTANKCRVTLDRVTDTYKLELFRIGKAPAYEVKTVYEQAGLYADTLRPVFERQTGLALSL